MSKLQKNHLFLYKVLWQFFFNRFFATKLWQFEFIFSFCHKSVAIFLLMIFLPQKKHLTNAKNQFFKLAIIARKLSKPASMFSTISKANSSGSGKLSKSANDLSFNQVISKLVLSLTIISS